LVGPGDQGFIGVGPKVLSGDAGRRNEEPAVEQGVGTDEASWCARFAGSRWSLASPLNPVFDGHLGSPVKAATWRQKVTTWVLRTLLLGLGGALGYVAWYFGSDFVVDRVFLMWSRPTAWQSAPTAIALAGCYQLSFGDWVPGDTGLQLDGCCIHEGHMIELMAKPADDQGTTDRGLAVRVESRDGCDRWWHWNLREERTVQLICTSSMGGLEAELGPVGTDLGGRARASDDTGRRPSMTALRAKRVSCPTIGGQS